MYESKMAVAVKVGGKVLREHGDTVRIPFGSEYSVLIKNLNTVRALVSISIDGQSITDGTQLIVPPNSSVDIERFIKNGNLSAGNRLKFIERTKSIEDGSRGIKIDDGLLRIEFEFEKPTQTKSFDVIGVLNTYDSYDSFRQFNQKTSELNNVGPMTATYSAQSSSLRSASKSTASASVKPQSDVGITVGGSISEQKFTAGSWFPTDGVKHVLVMKLAGEIEGQPVTKPITVKHKTTCPTCDFTIRGFAKFCPECGTGLLEV